MAISVGLTRLRNSDAVSKVMILVTDGANNAGVIDPITASNLAREMDIRIYAIGIGSEENILPDQMFLGPQQFRRSRSGFDEALLKRVAEITGGQYYRAVDAKALDQIFATINELEKTQFDETHYYDYNELAFPVMMAALALLVAGIVLDKFYFVQIP
jgi:Ca-activated chloride channel family protein